MILKRTLGVPNLKQEIRIKFMWISKILILRQICKDWVKGDKFALVGNVDHTQSESLMVHKNEQTTSFSTDLSPKGKMNFQQKMKIFIREKFKVNPNRPAAIPYVVHDRNNDHLNKSQEIIREGKLCYELSQLLLCEIYIMSLGYDTWF